jgi:outer membrane protein TolC
LAALSQEEVLTAAKARVELARASTNDAEARFHAGISSSNDVTRVQLELSAAERDLATAEAERLRARLRVAHILDTPIDAARPLVSPDVLLTEALVQADTTARPTESELTRLDVQALQKRAAAAAAFAQEPYARLAPTAGVQYRAYEGSLTLVLTWTLFDGGERYAERDERLALAAVAGLDVDAAARRASTETTDAMIGLSASRTVLEQAERTAEIARANNGETAELYRQGMSTALAIADASARLFDAEVVLARSRYAMAVSLLELRRAYGLDPFGKEPTQ